MTYLRTVVLVLFLATCLTACTNVPINKEPLQVPDHLLEIPAQPTAPKDVQKQKDVAQYILELWNHDSELADKLDALKKIIQGQEAK